MGTKQYIGARYVPKFAEPTEWQSNTQYEALTIVTRNGNSYTSKKFVPATIGAPENNSSYWASTGIYNQQVEAYREEVESLDRSLTALSGSVDDLRNDVDDDIDAVNDRITALSNLNIGRLQGKKILIAGSSNEMEQSGHWVTYFKNILNGIATVTINGGSGRNLKETMDVVETLYSSNDIIIVCCSTNDPVHDIPIGSMSNNTSTEYAYNFVRLRTMIENGVEDRKQWFVKGIMSTGYNNIFASLYPFNMYDACAYFGAKYAGATYINSKYAYGNIPTPVGVTHPGPERQEYCAYYMLNKILSGVPDDVCYEGAIVNTTVNNISYPRVSNLVTVNTDICSVSGLVLRCLHTDLEWCVQINNGGVSQADVAFITLNSELCKALNTNYSLYVDNVGGSVYHNPVHPMKFNSTTGGIETGEVFTHTAWCRVRIPYKFVTDCDF